MLNSEQKSTLISYLHIALESNKTPNEILLTILNLSEFIEREEHHHIEFLNFEKLGQVADICKAYAKALYYIENDFRNNNDFSSLEKLINLYYDLELPESAIGILKMAQLKEGLMNEDDWYLKLHQWKEALEVIEKKMKNNKNNDFDLNKESDKDLLNKKVTCLDGLSDWENLLSLGEEIENKNPNNQILSIKMAPTLAKASLNLKEWDKLKHYTEKIKPEVDEEIYEKNFFKAVISIKEEDYQNAKEYINCAREAINDKIKNLLTESYERAYKLLLANANLFDLEEIISLYNDPREDLFEENKKKNEKKMG
jgi:FKBP12-rapamycin complex-associated protein